MTAPMPDILLGDARALPLPDESVDLIVTSPPYFGLRDYGVAGQLGAEPTPAEFIAALIECTAEMVRVLKPSGSIFVNLGDKYSGAQGQTQTGVNGRKHMTNTAATWRQTDPKRTGIPAKSLMMLPERYRIAALDQLGLIARAVIVWAKPNGLPESVTDRVRRSHEDWVHLTKQPRYFASVDELREPHAGEFLASGVRNPRHRYADGKMPSHSAGLLGPSSPERGDGGTLVGAARHPLGKLPGSVWEIPTQPLKVPVSLGVDHFAAFPMEWPRRIIQGWSPREVCTACGEGRRPVTVTAEAYQAERARIVAAGRVTDREAALGQTSRTNTAGLSKLSNGVIRPDRSITGYACACPDTSAPSTPGVVLDPFSGTGTTALVATMLGRRGVGVELNPDYVRLAEWRANDPKERARAAGLDPDAVAKVHNQLPGQESLLDLFDGEAS